MGSVRTGVFADFLYAKAGPLPSFTLQRLSSGLATSIAGYFVDQGTLTLTLSPTLSLSSSCRMPVWIPWTRRIR